MQQKIKTIRTRLLHPHVPDCAATRYTRQGIWATPWAYFGDMEQRDRLGREYADKRGERWIRLRCNNISCRATLVVAEIDLLMQLPPT